MAIFKNKTSYHFYMHYNFEKEYKTDSSCLFSRKKNIQRSLTKSYIYKAVQEVNAYSLSGSDHGFIFHGKHWSLLRYPPSNQNKPEPTCSRHLTFWLSRL